MIPLPISVNEGRERPALSHFKFEFGAQVGTVLGMLHLVLMMARAVSQSLGDDWGWPTS